jgi:hypothetical protein
MQQFYKNIEYTIKGFHMVNDNYIKESVWEHVFLQFFNGITNNIKYDSGSHKPGSDCIIDNISYSNKTTIIKKNNTINISSYRLSSCNNNILKMIHEIDVVKKNFDFYSLLARVQHLDYITYKYYKIPSDFFTANNFTWEETKTQWKTNKLNGINLNIRKSMSFQLWINVDCDSIKDYMIHSVDVKKNEKIFYKDLYERLS